MLKLTDAVKRGLRYTDISDTSFNAVMDAIGMDASATSVIRDARNYLYGRYMHWKEDAEQNPGHVPNVTPPVIDEDFFRLRELESEVRNIEQVITSIGYSYGIRRHRMTERNAELPVNSVQNLAFMIPSSVIPAAEFEEGYETDRWSVASRSGNSEFEVVLNREDDTLTCSCRAFRREQHCWHSINVARYIAMRRQIQEHEQRLAEVREEIERLQNGNSNQTDEEETAIAA